MPEYKFKKRLQIAIDGPVASGKGTIAPQIAKKLGILYVDTGAMYRTVAYLAKINNLDFQDKPAILALLKKNRISLKSVVKKERSCLVFLNKIDVTDKIYTQEISGGSSKVAALPEVRSELVKKQQKIALGQSVVMEGRDITTRVLPNASLKIYLTADLAVRAKRRLAQLKKRGEKDSFSNVLKETKNRDYQDTNRETDPLRVAKDAYVLDNTDLTITQTIKKIIEKLKEKKLII